MNPTRFLRNGVCKLTINILIQDNHGQNKVLAEQGRVERALYVKIYIAKPAMHLTNIISDLHRKITKSSLSIPDIL